MLNALIFLTFAVASTAALAGDVVLGVRAAGDLVPRLFPVGAGALLLAAFAGFRLSVKRWPARQ